jgi:hypothetical protein
MSKKKKDIFDSPEIKMEGIEKFILDVDERIQNNSEVITNHLQIFNETLRLLAEDKEEIKRLTKSINLIFRILIGFSISSFILFVYTIFFK